MNRQILRLAVPNVISNISIPLLGIVDIAVAGRLNCDASIGAIAIGTSIFNFIYWNCAFIRMGTSGLTAQAYGAGDKTECANLLIRSVILAVAMSLLLVVLQIPVGRFSLKIMQGSDEVNVLAAQYFFARIWAAPAAISLFSIHGWFIGMQDSKTPMIVSIFSNVINIIFCIIFVFRYDMGLAGIGWAAVVAQYGSVALSWIIWVVKYSDYAHHIDWRGCLDMSKIVRFLHVNKDIFLRTVCVVVTYTFFTSASAVYGDTVLATNAILMQLVTLYSYMSDGFGYAAESLTGKFVGARDQQSLKKCIRYLCWWGFGIAVCYSMVYVVGWHGVLSLFTSSAPIIAYAGDYIEWVILIPLLGFFPFLVDGIMIGATKTKVLRNTVFISMVLYFATYLSLKGALGNNSLWLAFTVFIVARGVLLYFFTGRLSTKKMIEVDYI